MTQNTKDTGGSLRRSALNSSLWTAIGSVISQILRLGGNIVLAALLFQEAFALMAIIAAVTAGLQMFSDIGLAPSVVQNKRGDDQNFLNTAWTIQILRAIVLTIATCALAWPLASFYASNDPMAWELVGLLPLVAIGTLISGFQSSKLMSATRHINLGRVTVIELTAQLTGISLMVITAWLTGSVYALAIGNVASSATYCVLSHIALPGPRNRLRLEAEAVRSIIHFGKWIFLSSIICFLALQMDRLLFARLFPLDQVGVYAIAASVALVAPMFLGRLQGVIVFPLYSRMLGRRDALEVIVARSKTPMLAVGGYLIALSIAGAQTFIDIAYDERYTMAGLYIPILAGGAWFAAIQGIYGAAFLATGRSNLPAMVLGAKVIGFLALLLPAIKLAGFVGAVIAVAMSDVIGLIVAAYLAHRIGLKNFTTDVLYSVYTFFVGIGVLWLTRHTSFLSEAHSLIQFGTQLFLVTAAFAPLLLSAARSVLSQRQSIVR